MSGKNTRKSKRPLSIEEKFMITLGALLVADIFIHLLHPAYNTYKSLSKKLERDNESFQKKVITEFVPTLGLVASNSLKQAAVKSAGKSFAYSPLSPESDDSSDSAISRQRSITLPRGSSFFTMSGVSYLNVCGFTYRVGDYFDGSPILYINPVAMETINGRYTIVPDSRSPSLSLSQSQSLPPTQMEITTK